MRKFALTTTILLSITSQAQADVMYSFFQASFTASLNPSPDPFRPGPSGFVLRDSFVATNAELASGFINRAGNGINTPSYNLQIGSGGLLSGVVDGRLSDYDFRLTGQGGSFSGRLVYGDRFIADCAQPGCSISGFYTAVPEPMSMAAFGAGLLGLAFVRRRQTSKLG